MRALPVESNSANSQLIRVETNRRGGGVPTHNADSAHCQHPAIALLGCISSTTSPSKRVHLVAIAKRSVLAKSIKDQSPLMQSRDRHYTSKDISIVISTKLAIWSPRCPVGKSLSQDRQQYKSALSTCFPFPSSHFPLNYARLSDKACLLQLSLAAAVNDQQADNEYHLRRLRVRLRSCRALSQPSRH